MTNIEKVKRILDAGHWVKVTYEDGVTRIITSYYNGKFGQCMLSYVRTDADIMFVLSTPDFKDCTIEVIQRNHFPNHCLAPAFEEDSLSGKEAKVTIDGKEYSVTLKLI